MCITGNFIIDNDIIEILSEKLNWHYFSNKSILITGANGMIPAYFVYIFLGLNESILKTSPIKLYALVRNKEKAQKKFSIFMGRSDFELIVSDISHFVQFKKPLDVIIHGASQASPKFYGKDPVGTLKANTIGTINLLELAVKKKVQKFLYISSGEVYGIIGDSIKSISETYTGNVDITSVRSCYAESKRMGETACVCYSHQYNVHTNMIRLGHTYAPGCDLDDGRVFADFAKNIVSEKNIKLNSDGRAKRAFMYITDMIKAAFYVLLKAKSGEAYNIASETETSILKFAEICVSVSHRPLKVEFAKNVLTDGYIKSQSTGACYSVEKLKSLGWRQTVDIRTGMERMIASYEK